MSKLSFVIPVYQNAKNLIPYYEEIKNCIIPFIDEYEIVMVDDGSSDNSWEVMNTIADLDNNVKILKLSRNFGATNAFLAGLEYATGDCVCTKAADLQEPPETTIEMYNSWKRGNNVVLAVREEREDTWLTRAFSTLYYRIVRKLIFSRMPSTGFDIYLLDRKVVEVLKAMDEKNSSVVMQILWVGFKTDTVLYKRKKRLIGKSSWTMRKKINLFADSVISFSYFPIRFISFVGFVTFGISILWGVYMILMRLLGRVDVKGYTTLLVVILFSTGLITLTLGILGEYIWRTFDACRNRPAHIVEEKRV